MAASQISDGERVHLKLNQARVDFFNNYHEKAYVWTQYKECEKCPYFDTPLSLSLNETKQKLIHYYYSLKYAVTLKRNSTQQRICHGVIDAQEHSIHRVIIENDSCHSEITQEGRNEFYLIFVGLAAVALVIGAIYLARYLFRIYKGNSVGDDDGELKAKLSTRQNCLDAIRGVTILLMIFVNWGAGRFDELDHAPWDGLHFADFIFPNFIFVMGATMSISLRTMVIKKDLPLGHIYVNITTRALKLFFLGLVLGSMGNPDLRELRIPGVLQRFAVSYFVVAAVHVASLHLSRDNDKSPFDYLSDLIPFWLDWLLALSMLIIYFVMTFAWKFADNCPAGYLGPGGLADNAQYASCTGGAAAKLDELIFSKKHIYQDFTAAPLYDPDGKFGVSHDPEGLLGCTTSIFLTIIGLQMGKILFAYETLRDRMIRMSIWALALSTLSVILAATGAIPINKNLWSFTFVCVTGAVSIFVFMLFHVIIDHFKWWHLGTPFHYPGMNTILLYIGHDFTSSILPFAFYTHGNSHFWFLFQNITGVSIWLLISVYLAKKHIFFTL